jgi:hypothetical protein
VNGYRAKDVSEELQEISWKAKIRLFGKYEALITRGKLKV